MSNPKIKPCPGCSGNSLAVYKYESGWQYVECDQCWYRGPGEGSIRAAIKSHNEKAIKSTMPPESIFKPEGGE